MLIAHHKLIVYLMHRIRIPRLCKCRFDSSRKVNMYMVNILMLHFEMCQYQTLPIVNVWGNTIKSIWKSGGPAWLWPISCLMPATRPRFRADKNNISFIASRSRSIHLETNACGPVLNWHQSFMIKNNCITIIKCVRIRTYRIDECAESVSQGFFTSQNSTALFWLENTKMTSCSCTGRLS